MQSSSTVADATVRAESPREAHEASSLQRTHRRPRLRDGKATRSDRNGRRHRRLVSHESVGLVDTFTRLRRLSRRTRLHVRQRRPGLPVPERAAVPIPVHRRARPHREPMSARSGAVSGPVPDNPLAAGQSEIVSSTPVARHPLRVGHSAASAVRSRWGEQRTRRGQAKNDANDPKLTSAWSHRTVPGDTGIIERYR